MAQKNSKIGKDTSPQPESEWTIGVSDSYNHGLSEGVWGGGGGGGRPGAHSTFAIFYFLFFYFTLYWLDADLKIVLVGAAAVGKTSLIHRYINDDFGNTTAVRLAFFSP